MIIGNYTVERQISEGSFGRTFFARHTLLGLPVCLKQEKTGDPTFKKLFAEEAKLLWPLRHVSLPVMRDYFDLPSIGQVIAMSFVEGDVLDNLVATRGAIDDEHICWILQRVLGSLSYLHFHTIVHCDIKPSNIILDIPVHNATLVDFGLSLTGARATTRAKGGTPLFQPPEFALGLPPIPASDLYSLGMTAVFLAGGDVRNGSLPPDMHKDLAEIITGMIRRDPIARPQRADDVIGQINNFRNRVYGRNSTKEAFKLRGGVS